MALLTMEEFAEAMYQEYKKCFMQQCYEIQEDWRVLSKEEKNAWITFANIYRYPAK